ncbi:MAG: hypothetical protein ACREHD_05830, partial [Pirellulales bacterium]
AESKSGYAAIGKLIHQGLLRSFDDLVADMGGPEPETFRIPQRYFHWRCNSVEELIALGPVLARAYGIGLGNRLFPQDGWTQTVWRNGVCLLADGRTEASDDLSCQPTDDRGSLCALVSAEILRAAGQGPLAAVCVRRGLRRLSPAAFRDDCRDLLGGRGLLSECFLQMAGALRTLNADEVKAIAALLTRLDVLDEAQAGIFEQCASALRTESEATTPQAAAHALDVLWRAGLSDRVERRLKSLTAPPEPPMPPPFAYTYGASDDVYLPGATDGPPAVFGKARPATAEGVYRAALPGETPGYFPAPGTSQPDDGPDSPPEPPKPIQQEVRELKWLAMALTDRLKKLEGRLQSDEGEAAEAALPIPEPSATDAEQKAIVLGLEGYCPVALVQKRIWQRGKAEFSAVHHGRTYLLADKDALEAFLKKPDRYAPALDGNDPVLAVDKGATVAGRREHGAFYNGRVYLFSDEETFRTFDASPERYLESPQASADAATPPAHSEVTVEKIAAPADNQPTRAEKDTDIRGRSAAKCAGGT